MHWLIKSHVSLRYLDSQNLDTFSGFGPHHTHSDIMLNNSGVFCGHDSSPTTRHKSVFASFEHAWWTAVSSYSIPLSEREVSTSSGSYQGGGPNRIGMEKEGVEAVSYMHFPVNNISAQEHTGESCS